MTMTHSGAARSQGVSLIELMVALAITALLLLGVSEIFLGSRATFTVQQAMSRSQENARFAFNYFEDSIRMAGYFGCGNESDQLLQTNNYNHILAAGATDPASLVNFHRPIEGFDYTACDGTSCDTDGNQPAVGAAGEWSPSLADSGIPLSGSANPVKGSDVLVLRTLSAESAPLLGVPNYNSGAKAEFTLGAVPGDPGFVKENGVYAVTNCLPRVDVFVASPGSSGTSLIAGSDVNLMQFPGASPPGPWSNINVEGVFDQPPLGMPVGTLNAEAHQAEYMAFFVGLDAAGNPALKMQHYSGAMNGALPGVTVEDLADGVEAMQVLYGVDTNGDGLADDFETAAGVMTHAAGSAPAQIDAAWRMVVSVRVGLLMRGQDIAGVPANSLGNQYTVEDAVMTRPADGRYRDVYETTIALRNRLTSF